MKEEDEGYKRHDDSRYVVMSRDGEHIHNPTSTRLKPNGPAPFQIGGEGKHTKE